MNTFTITGNLTADPELRFTPSGAAVASFTVAHTERVKDGNEWKDGDTLFIRCSVWRKQAELVGESLSKGDPVVVTGKLKQRSFEAKDGAKHTVMEMDAETVAVALTRHIVRIQRENNLKVAVSATSDASPF